MKDTYETSNQDLFPGCIQSKIRLQRYDPYFPTDYGIELIFYRNPNKLEFLGIEVIKPEKTCESGRKYLEDLLVKHRNSNPNIIILERETI